jgi:hypothetical protein
MVYHCVESAYCFAELQVYERFVLGNVYTMTALVLFVFDQLAEFSRTRAPCRHVSHVSHD